MLPAFHNNVLSLPPEARILFPFLPISSKATRLCLYFASPLPCFMLRAFLRPCIFMLKVDM